MSNYSFSGQKVLVTGGAGGIGSAIVAGFVSAGAKVAVTGTSQEKIDTFLSENSNLFAGNVHGILCNLKLKEEAEVVISKAVEVLGGLDVLVCNAGITKDKLCIRMSNEDWQDVIDVNLTANFILNRNAIKYMIKQNYGRIVNIASVVAISGNAGQANYVASKAGLIGMTKSMAKEVASKCVTINVVAPGFIETAMTDVLPQQIKDKVLASIPVGCFGKPEDIANAVCFLASKSSSYITGETINVNGGMLMSS